MSLGKDDIDNLDLLSAIWILASNDDNPLISYKGIMYRLDLADEAKLRKIIAARPELFRKGATKHRIEAWKADLRNGKNVPAWISQLKSPEDRSAAIESLSSEDVFRSQFRAHSNAERSPIEVIKWGLEHLDRLRKAKSEQQEAVAKRWQMWLVFWVSLAGVVTQFAIAYWKATGKG